jgi:uncharacterized protein
MSGYLADTNVWIALQFEKHPSHQIAVDFMEIRAEGTPIFFARIVEHSFLRLISTAAICRTYSVPVHTNVQAVEILEGWHTQPHIRCLDTEPEGTRELWLELAAIPSASPKVWMDAYLAAFAIRAGLPFATLDSDFRKFEAAGLDLLLLSA